MAIRIFILLFISFVDELSIFKLKVLIVTLISDNVFCCFATDSFVGLEPAFVPFCFCPVFVLVVCVEIVLAFVFVVFVCVAISAAAFFCAIICVGLTGTGSIVPETCRPSIISCIFCAGFTVTIATGSFTEGGSCTTLAFTGNGPSCAAEAFGSKTGLACASNIAAFALTLSLIVEFGTFFLCVSLYFVLALANALIYSFELVVVSVFFAVILP